MIKKMQIKLIALSMAALFILLSVIVISMNVLNYNAVVAEADQTLSIMAANRGIYPIMKKVNALRTFLRKHHLKPVIFLYCLAETMKYCIPIPEKSGQ